MNSKCNRCGGELFTVHWADRCPWCETEVFAGLLGVRWDCDVDYKDQQHLRDVLGDEVYSDLAWKVK